MVWSALPWCWGGSQCLDLVVFLMIRVSELRLQTSAALPAWAAPGTGALRDLCSLGAGMLAWLGRPRPCGQVCQVSLGAGVTTAGSTSGGSSQAGRGGQRLRQSQAGLSERVPPYSGCSEQQQTVTLGGFAGSSLSATVAVVQAGDVSEPFCSPLGASQGR